jgi:hypothetical protein
MFKVNGLFYSFKMTSEEYNYFEKQEENQKFKIEGPKL